MPITKREPWPQGVQYCQHCAWEVADEGLLDSEDVFQLTHRSATVVTDHSLEGPEVALNMSFHAAIDPGDMSQTPVVFGVKALGLPRAQAQRKHASRLSRSSDCHSAKCSIADLQVFM